MAGRAILLVNLGTPDSTETSDVRKYLKQFLSDPRVIDIAGWARWLLLNLIILPTRPKKSAAAYKEVWTKRGSPLLFNTQDLAEKLQKRLGTGVVVDFAMRYQSPSIASKIREFKKQGIDQMTVLPLFPQYSSAANGSAAEEVFRVLSKEWNVPQVEVLKEFYDHPKFIEAFANVGNEALQNFEHDKIVFSFHGLPERHCIKSDESETGHCLKSPHCCDKIIQANRRCYRAQCFATAKLIAEKMGLESTKWEIAFQSRLGRDPWIRPYTDVRFEELPKEGIKKIAVFSPAFVADCLETLEELQIRGKEAFIKAGGEDLMLIPSLNSNDLWVEAVEEIIKDYSRF